MDNEVYFIANGEVKCTGTVKCNKEKPNFVIICQYGDWSGFRTLAECVAQFDELKNNTLKMNNWYAVVER